MFDTGVPGLNRILGGGLREGDVYLVVGPAGSGKTTLTLQTGFRAAAADQNVLYVSTLSEPPNRLLQHVKPFPFCDESLIGKRLFLLNAYPLITKSLETVSDAIAEAVREHEAKLVVVDGLATIRDLHPESRELRTLVYELGSTLSVLGCTTILTSSLPEAETERQPQEFTMVDGVVELGMQDLGTQTYRTVRVRKARGQAPLLGQHALQIDGSGLTVHARLESLPVSADVGLSTDRLAVGLPELDAMMEGGLPQGSITLLAGGFGTGKSLACLHFLAEGARRGERGLFVGFRETPRQLADRARLFGLGLAGPDGAEMVTILHRTPIDLVFDEAIGEIWREVERLRPSRLVIDSITDLQEGIFEERRTRGLMSALSGLLRGQRITSIITREISQVVGPELSFADTPLAVLAENLLLLRYVEFGGELRRILSILKMRDSRHDHTIRQYEIGERGLKVLTALEDAEGTLTGFARRPAEPLARRGTGKPRGGGLTS